VTTVDLQVGSLASGGEGSVLVFAASSIDVTGANTTILGANSFSGVVQVTAGTMSIAGPLELATDSDPGTNGTLSASSNGSVTLGDVEIGGGSSTSAGAFILSTGGTID
jgi:autotransporter-associated beta strand protein